MKIELVFQDKSTLDQIAERALRPIGFLCRTTLGKDAFKVYHISHDNEIQLANYSEISTIRKISFSVFYAFILLPATFIGLGCKICFYLTKSQKEIRQLWRNYQLMPPTLTQFIDSVAVQAGAITMGQGEYVVFRQSDHGEVLGLTEQEFGRIFSILEAYAPARLAKTQPEECENRYDLLNKAIKQVDSSYRILFIPKTFYELMYIERCIQEDLEREQPPKEGEPKKMGASCLFSEPGKHRLLRIEKQEVNSCIQQMKQQSKQEGCWHSHYFTKIEVNSEEIQSLAFRLNEVALTHLNKNADRTLFVDGLTHDQWLNLLNEKLNFLKENRKKASSIDFRNGLGSTAQFLCDGGRCNPMGIRDEKDEQLYKNALKLDCSDSAKSCAWIYRGGDFQKDSLVSWDNENRPYSLSYGTSAFAGCIFDPTATAMYYMQKRDTPNAYAIPIRFKDLADSPFYVPNSHTLVQLCSDGEVFHARTKAWKNFNPKDMGGFNLGVDGGERSHLKSELTREDLMKKFIQYKAVAIQLK